MRSETCLWMLAACVLVCHSETIHFTNSPTHLLGSKNFTTYKLLVKDSDPITIIEANKEINPAASVGEVLPNRRSDIDVKSYIDVNDDDAFGTQPKKTLQIDTRPLSMTVTKDVNPSEGSTRNSDTEGDNGLKKLVYSPILLKKFVKEYAEKLKNADADTKNAIKEISEKINQNGNIPDEASKQDDVEEKYNYNANFDRDRRRPGSSTPYKDRDGWVTLEAVPWSSSTVSKWHGHQHHEEEKPASGYASFNDRVYSINSHRPGNYHHEEEEYYQRPKPYGSRPVSDDRPTYTAWSKPQAFNRPARPQGGYSSGGSGSAFNDHDDWYDRDRPYGGKPWTGDIITDTRPSNFPKQPLRRPGYSDAEPYSNDEEDRYRPASSQSESQHPVNGNGEWVLISTTKGYQIPGRRQNGRRSLKFSVPASMDTTSGDITAHKSVKLTVLPALKGNSTFSSDPNKKPVTSHGGMLEVDSSHQTIEAAVIDAKKQAAKPPPKDTKKRKVLRVKATKNNGDKSTEILAAVGAGMVPATVAMLMPIVLGRKRRSYPAQFQPENKMDLIKRITFKM